MKKFFLFKIPLLFILIILIIMTNDIFAKKEYDKNIPITIENEKKTLHEDIKLHSKITAGYYKVESLSNNLHLQSPNYENNSIIELDFKNNKSSQIIYFQEQNEGSYILSFYNNKKIISLNENNLLVQKNSHNLNLENQKWIIYEDGKGNILFKNKSNERFLEVSNSKLNLSTDTEVLDPNSSMKFILTKVIELPTTPYIVQIQDGLYKIQSAFSGKNLEIFGGSLGTDDILSQWSNNGYNNQIFEVENTENGSYIIGSESNKPLGTEGYSDGSKIIQQNRTNSLSQQYQIIKSKNNFDTFSIISNGGTTFDVQYPSNGSQVVLRNINNTIYQDFKFIPTDLEKSFPRKENLKPYTDLKDGYYSIVSNYNNLALEATDYNNGSIIKQNPKADKSSQNTYFKKQNDGSYVITFLNSNKSLDICNNNLTQWDLHKLDNQKWFLYKDDEGKILFKSKKNGSYIESRNSVVNNNLLMNTNLAEFNPKKKFNIISVENLSSETYIAEAPNGLYKIQSLISRKNLEIYGGSLKNGRSLSQFTNNGYNNQVFKVQNTNTDKYIISTEIKKILDTSSYNYGNKIIQADKKEKSSQIFKSSKSENFNGAFNIVSKGDMVFDVQYSSNGSQIVLRNINKTIYQDFNFIATNSEKSFFKKVKSKILNVPAIRQIPELPSGCEITAITMMLQYSGANVDKVTMAWKMPYHHLDPNYGYVGSPFYKTGWTIYPPALTEIVSQYAGSSYDMSGRSITDIENQIINNKAVVVWVSDFHGFTVHAITINGFDENLLYYNDPWTGTKNNSIFKSYFNKVWSKQSKRAISY